MINALDIKLNLMVFLCAGTWWFYNHIYKKDMGIESHHAPGLLGCITSKSTGYSGIY
jgi:hypothetical protein